MWWRSNGKGADDKNSQIDPPEQDPPVPTRTKPSPDPSEEQDSGPANDEPSLVPQFDSKDSNTAEVDPAQNRKSWWGWRSAQTEQQASAPSAPKDPEDPQLQAQPKAQPKDQPKDQGNAQDESHVESSGQTAKAGGASAWAFWNRSKNSGQLAVSGTDTESHPKHAHIVADAVENRAKKAKHQNPSTLVPSFQESFDNPSLFGKIWAKRPYIVSPPRVNKAVVVGVHGYFPARIARTILGEPTGTSLKFATEGAAMLEKWAEQHHRKISIEKIALEGEGRIAQREKALFDLLKNWLDLLREADFILFAVHSQGAVVGIHIIARLLEEYRIKAKIGIVSMAGVCLGPMPGMDQNLVMKAISTIEHASLTELFELQNPTSLQSQKFRHDLDLVLGRGVKIVFVGSVDDQLVPLYSALCVHADHPNIFRAVYLDGDTVSPDFLAPLLDLVVKRRNMGLSDFGLLTDISSALPSSLTGQGHSRLYSSDKVYTLALETILEVSNCTNVPTSFHEFSLPKANPYLLPWSVNSVLSDPIPSLRESVARVYKEYGTWKPATKPMKELKYRLAALKKAKL